MEPIQITIIVISLILTSLMVFLGIQVWHILKEMRFMFQKMNKMLEDMGKVTGTVGDTFTGMSGLVNGLRTGLSLFTSFNKKGGTEHDE